MANPSPQKSTSSANHERAPKIAAFVEEHRKVFGKDQVKVLYVREGKFTLGEPQ